VAGARASSRKGEQGIKILVPFKHKATVAEEDETDAFVVKGFGVGTVFDVSQTDGDPLPSPPAVERIDGASDRGMRLFVDLIDYLEIQDVPIAREHTKPANGYFDPKRRRVALDVDLNGDQAAKTLTHEACHVVAGHTLGMNSQDVETVAESAAFVVLNHYGIDSSGYTFPYVAGWAQDRAVLKRNLGAVQQTAHRIGDAMHKAAFWKPGFMHIWAVERRETANATRRIADTLQHRAIGSTGS
jgi:hypothetical protein